MENKARVISQHKGAYKVKNENGEFLAKVTGKQMFTANTREDYPAVGDWVIIDELPENNAVIKEILPRQTIIKRTFGDKNKSGKKNDTQVIATNIDVAFVVESIGRDYNLNRLERYFAIVSDQGIKPAVLLNKIDLISKAELAEKISEIKTRFPDIDVVATSTVGGESLNELKNYLENGKTYCFLGSSGVGKSSLINKLLGDSIIKTGEVSQYSDRGKHVTTGRQMYFLTNGAIVIDNPGIREVGMANASPAVDSAFEKVTELALQCKFKDCTHTHEKGCKVLEAVQADEISKQQYENYLNLKKESDYYEMSEIKRKEKKRDFGKFVNTAKKTLKKYGHKI